MSTIHHPQEWLARVRRFQPPTGLPGRRLYRSPIGRSIPSSEAIREVAMLVLQRRFRHLGAVVPWWTNRVKWLLANAARIALASPAERIYLERDFAYRCRPEQVLVLPNWVEGAEDVSSSPPPQFQQLPEPPVIVTEGKWSVTLCSCGMQSGIAAASNSIVPFVSTVRAPLRPTTASAPAQVAVPP